MRWGKPFKKGFRRLGPEDDLDIDAVRDLDPHELAQCTLVSVEVYQTLMDPHLPPVPRSSEPSPSGLFLTGTTKRLVGRGIGPRMATPVLWEIDLICPQTLSTFLGSVPAQRNSCSLCHSCVPRKIGRKGVYITLFSTSRQIPAATVWPMSRMANLPSWGNSLAFSMTIGLEGWILTIAASPVFRNWGFSSLTAPVAGSSFFWSSRKVQAT